MDGGMRAIWHAARMGFDVIAVCMVVALVVPLGIVLCVLLALVLDAVVLVVDRMLTPWRRAVTP